MGNLHYAFANIQVSHSTISTFVVRSVNTFNIFAFIYVNFLVSIKLFSVTGQMRHSEYRFSNDVAYLQHPKRSITCIRLRRTGHLVLPKGHVKLQTRTEQNLVLLVKQYKC